MIVDLYDKIMSIGRVNMLKIINYGHSCFKFISDDLSVIFDPYQGIDGLEMKEVSANYCFTSHDHFDHNAVQYVNLIPSEKNLNIGYLIVPHDHDNGAKRGLNKIHMFSLGGYKIAHLGDIGCIPDKETLEKLKGFDIILAPINGFYTISSDELIRLMELIKPRLTIPMHYYQKERNIGLKDDGQIDMFKKKVKYTEINNTSIIVNEDIFVNPALIFNKSEGDLR